MGASVSLDTFEQFSKKDSLPSPRNFRTKNDATGMSMNM